MAAVSTFTKTGAKAATPAKLDKDVFGLEVGSHELLKAAYVAHLANARRNLAVTKTRGKVSGGGKKPWRQKGTGRARFGSSRNPIWRGGGIAFGPTGLENYAHKLTPAAKRQATRQALSMAVAEKRLRVIEALESKDGKTQPMLKFLAKLDVRGNVLVVVEQQNDLLTRATQNLPNVHVVSARYLSAYRIINADTIVITSKALDILHEWLKPTATTTKESA